MGKSYRRDKRDYDDDDFDKKSKNIKYSFDQESDWSKKMLMAKKNNTVDFWPQMVEVFNNDIQTLPLEFFKVWASVMIVPLISTPKHMEYIQLCTHEIRNDEVYHEALKEPMIGINEHLFKHMYSVFDNYPTSMNRIHHMSHLIISDFKRQDLCKMDRIIEIGAGSGDMADIIFKLGFTGEYVIYDLEPLTKIHKYYHNELGHRNIKYITNPDELESGDLCIATWSLTEMPLDLRSNIINKLCDTKNWLLCYSDKIFNYSNKDWIDTVFLDSLNISLDFSHMWRIPVPWMPWDGGTEYLVIKS
jgi:hypothetical protein